MPPAAGPKRKRSDRKSSQENPRASPHLPDQLDLASRQSDDGAEPQSRRQSRNGVPHTDPAMPRMSDLKSPSATPAPVIDDTVMTNGNQNNSKGQVAPSADEFRIYDHVTEAIIKNWSANRNAVLQKIVDCCENEDDVGLDSLITELIESGTNGRLDPTEAGLVIKDAITATASAEDVDSPVQDATVSICAVLFSDNEEKTVQAPLLPNADQLSALLDATNISLETLRLEFDQQLLMQLNLVSAKFKQKFIKTQTDILYRQANYNLLREESEGFSKLITELFTTSAHELPHASVVTNTVAKVKAMIGAFDLDVGRTLDVTLDVFGSVLVKQYRFFVKFLRASPWWPNHSATTPLSGKYAKLSGLPLWAMPDHDHWHLTDEQQAEIAHLIYERDTDFWNKARELGMQAFFHLNQGEPTDIASLDPAKLSESKQEWLKETGTLPRAGSREAAQLLGFKLRFYAPGSEGDSPDGTPKNLIYLAALLIKIGFISLHDLYPHLWRPDEEMDQLKEIKTKEKAERERAARPGGGTNALANAGALTDDTASTPALTAPASRLKDTSSRANTPGPESEKAKDAQTERPDQKVLLLQSLLAIGALPEALFILGRFPWMMDLIHELPEYLSRIIHHCLSQVYDQLRPLEARSSLHAQMPIYDPDVPAATATAKLELAPARRTLRWPVLDRDDNETDGINYKFYWDEWNDNIPACHSVDDVFVLCKTLVPLVGAKIGYDPSLILKFTRIGKASLREDDSSQNRDRWLDLIKRLILPAISQTQANPGVVNEVYELISFYPTQTRYQMYLEWLNGNVSRTPDMVLAKAQADAETKDVLRRISKTNVKPMARALAKIAYANPHVVVDRALRQIEVYDSIADVFVEGARYFTDLGYDVLTWSLVMAFGKDNRVGMQADGLFTSRWLTALSHFIGKIYKRYALMKPAPILQYVAKQLDNGIHIDLVTLEQMISSMAGIAPDTNFNDAQLLAMGGGPLLQAQTMLQLLDQRHALKPTAKRLMKALHDCGLVGKLLVALAKQRQSCVYDAGDAPLKVVGHTFDEITRVLSQYLELLRSNLSIEDFQKHVPSAVTMFKDYDIPVEIAFWIGRPVIHAQMIDYDKDESANTASKESNGDAIMADTDDASEDGEAGEIEEAVMTIASTADDDDENITIRVDDDTVETAAEVNESWHPVLRGIIDSMHDRIPEDVHSTIGAGFYVTFWQLSLYDINVPGTSYEDEINRHRKKKSSIKADRSNISSTGAKQRNAQVAQLDQLIDDLLVENRSHLKAYSESRGRLTKEKEQWFATKGRIHVELNKALMEYCFLPRILLSPLDAYFAFRFAKTMHQLGTANFRTLNFYDLFFNADRLTSLFFICTSRESENLGKFLLEVLKDLGRWHSMKSTYEREAFGSKKNLPGFALRIENGKAQLLLEYEKFRTIIFKWHSQLFSALVKCLASPEYMHVRNAISILRTVSAVFPVVDHHGKALAKAAEKLGESDREDLKVASQALRAALHRRQKDWVPAMTFRQGISAPTEKSTATSQPARFEAKPTSKPPTNTESSKKLEVRRREDTSNDAEMSSKRDPEKAPSIASKDGGRSPSRATTPLPVKPPRENASTRPLRGENRHDLPRRLSPPPRSSSSSNLPSRSEPDSRNGYRDNRSRGPPVEPPRSDSRGSFNSRHASERPHESAHEPPSRYAPRSFERPSMLDRDDRDRTPNREHESRKDVRGNYDERRHNERETRPERDSRSARDMHSERESRHEREHARTTERDVARPNERPDRAARDHGRPAAEPQERRREDLVQSSRREGTRTETPPSTAPAINPERAALIHGNDDSKGGISIRGSAQQDRSRPSRPTSPRRDSDRRHGARDGKDDRPSRRSDVKGRDAPQQPATNTRGFPPSGPAPRDGRGHASNDVDMSHGRLEQEPQHRPPPRPERPNETEPPSGPRARPSSSSLRNTETPPARPPPQTRQPPSGPGARHTRNNSFVESNSSQAGNEVGIHPDRMNNIAADPARPQRPPNVQNSPPSGPRGNTMPPTGPSVPSPNSRAPPSGPQAEGGRGRHPMAAVNNTLAQAAQSPRGHNSRGRGSMRQNSISYSNSMPQSPVGGPPQGYPSQSPMNNPNDIQVQPRGPPRQENHRDERQARHGNDRRPDSGYKQDGPPRGPPTNPNLDPPGPPRNGPRGYPRGPNPNGDREDGPPTRKHGRDESMSAPYGGRGGRMASDSKRPRRGG